MLVLGIDPGGKHTALVVADTSTRRAVTARTVVRDHDEPLADLATEITSRVESIAAATRLDLIAVEGLNAPSPHLGLINVRGLIDTAFVAGAVYAAATRLSPTVLVPPARHGTAPLSAYPPELVGARETTGRGKGPRQHARAAFDVACAAVPMFRFQQATRGR